MQINLNPTSERGASREAVNRPRETLGDSHLISSDPRSRFGLVCDLLCCRGNIFLHYVLDEWFEKEVRPRLKGEAFVIRYADDFVIGAGREDDARRIMEVLPKRMSKYGLTVHPEKTRLVRFQPLPADDFDTEGREPPDPKTFDFLGLTHYWGRSRQGDGWLNGRRRRADSSVRYRAVGMCHKNLHLPIRAAPEARAKAARPLRVLRDHWQLLQPPGIREEVRRIWRHKLSRRRRDGDVTWAEFLHWRSASQISSSPWSTACERRGEIMR